MKPRVTVVDYGVGNLLSVVKALEIRGAEVELSGEPVSLLRADRVLIPGVGAFGDGMMELQKRGLDEALRTYAVSGKPLLGICLGMQLLFGESDEFGIHRGLGILPGRVAAIPNRASNGAWRKTPHIGWNELRAPAFGRGWEGTLLAGVPPGAATYFVHSFAAQPDESVRLADCNYEGFIVSAAVQRGKVCGCQFHPEKSGEVGLAIVGNFLSM